MALSNVEKLRPTKGLSSIGHSGVFKSVMLKTKTVSVDSPKIIHAV